MDIERRGFLSAAGALLLAGGTAGWATQAEARTNNQRRRRRGNDEVLQQLVSVRQGPDSLPYIGMTFDDGPHPTNTPALLDILKARNIRATFYVIGWRVAKNPEIVKRIVDEGHELGNHTWSHPALAGVGKTRLFREIDRTNEAIYNAVRMVPVTMRSPYGSLTTAQAKLIHAERGLITTMWSVDPEDWRRPGSSVVANRIVSRSKNGSIVLSHDIHSPTIRAMPAALDGLVERGFEFSTLSMLIGARDWNRKRFTWTPPAT